MQEKSNCIRHASVNKKKRSCGKKKIKNNNENKDLDLNIELMKADEDIL